MSGCSKDEEKFEDTGIDDASQLHQNYEMPTEDAKELEAFINTITTDMGKIVMSNQDKNGDDLKDNDALKDFAKKYALSENMHFTTEFFDYTKKIYDGANSTDGKFDNKLEKPSKIELNEVVEGYMPLFQIGYSFNDYKKWNIDTNQFSNVVVKAENMKDEDRIFTFEYSKDKLQEGYGFYGNNPWGTLTVKEELTEDVKKSDEIPTFVVKLVYKFDKTYPKVNDGAGGTDIDMLFSLMNDQGANFLEFMVIKTNNGYKLVNTKWTLTQINYFTE